MTDTARCKLSAGDLTVTSSWLCVFVSCDGTEAWSMEASPEFGINMGAVRTLQCANGEPRGIAMMQPTLLGAV